MKHFFSSINTPPPPPPFFHNGLNLLKKAILFAFLFLLFSVESASAGLFSKPVINDDASFTIARTIKLGREKSNGQSGLNVVSGGTGGQVDDIKTCTTGCTACNTSTGICTKCSSGYYLSDGKCVSCPANATCNGTTFTCTGGYAQQGTKCTECGPNNCLTCPSVTTCTGCKSGYTLIGGNCVKDIIENCVSYNSQGICQSCQSGYTLSNNRCEPNCPSDCLTCSNTTTCTTCYSGDYLSSGRCLSCSEAMPGCTACSGASTCTACDTGYTLLGSTCIKGTCSDHGQCPTGYTCNNANGEFGMSCKICQSGSNRGEERNDFCNCPIGTLSDGKGNCVKQTASCPAGTYINGSSCSTCASGTYTSGSNQTSCKACSTLFVGSNVTCTSCTAAGKCIGSNGGGSSSGGNSGSTSCGTNQVYKTVTFCNGTKNTGCHGTDFGKSCTNSSQCVRGLCAPCYLSSGAVQGSTCR